MGGVNPNSENAAYDNNAKRSILCVDESDATKTTRLMTVTEGGITKLHVKADTELTLNGSVIVNNVDIQDISAGTQTNDVKITLDNEVVEIASDDENQRILDADDAVTTVTYSDSNKDSVSNIATSSAGLARKVTDTYNNGGATTLVITRVVADV